MGLLSKLKSLLGADDDGSRGRNGVDVTVEREADTESERTDDEAAGGGDASASTESLVDESHTDDPTRAAEPSEAAAAADDDSESVDDSDIEEAEPETDAGDGESDAGDSEAAAGDGESVDTVKGIGPAYAERLEGVGVETVADLAAADPAEVADAIDLSEKRVGQWVERAKERQ